MKKKNPLRTAVTILLIAIAVVLLVRHFNIRSFNIISPGVLYTSGQPRGMDYTRLLHKYHIATIINLRSPAEHRERNWYHEETTWVRSNSVKYFEMPLDRNPNSPGHFPDADIQKQFLAIMADKNNLPALVHDSRGKSRVAMFAATWLIKAERLPVQQVLDTARKIKSAPLTKAEEQFVNTLAK